MTTKQTTINLFSWKLFHIIQCFKVKHINGALNSQTEGGWALWYSADLQHDHKPLTKTRHHSEQALIEILS